MIRLVKTNRRINFEGVTLTWIVSVTLFFVAILALFVVSKITDSQISPCLLRTTTSLPCFLCGGTRASLSLASGNVTQAFAYNPLVTSVLVIWTIALILKFCFGVRIERRGFLADRRALWLIAIVAVTSNWIYIIRTLF